MGVQNKRWGSSGSALTLSDQPIHHHTPCSPFEFPPPPRSQTPSPCHDHLTAPLYRAERHRPPKNYPPALPYPAPSIISEGLRPPTPRIFSPELLPIPIEGPSLCCCYYQPFSWPVSLGISLDASVKGGDGGHESRMGSLALAQSVKATLWLPCSLGSSEGSSLLLRCFCPRCFFHNSPTSPLQLLILVGGRFLGFTCSQPSATSLGAEIPSIQILPNLCLLTNPTLLFTYSTRKVGDGGFWAVPWLHQQTVAAF